MDNQSKSKSRIFLNIIIGIIFCLIEFLLFKYSYNLETIPSWIRNCFLYGIFEKGYSFFVFVFLFVVFVALVSGQIVLKKIKSMIHDKSSDVFSDMFKDQHKKAEQAAINEGMLKVLKSINSNLEETNSKLEKMISDVKTVPQIAENITTMKNLAESVRDYGD